MSHIQLVIIVLTLAASLLMSTVQQKATEMAEMIKQTQPGDHHKQLNTLTGRWDVIVRFKYGSGPEREAKAVCDAKWILGGRFIQQDYSSESGLSVLQFVGYDNQKKRFLEIKFDNMDTGVLHTEGEISSDGKVITNYGDRMDPMTGKRGRLRTVTTLIDKDHYTLEWYLVAEDGSEVRTVAMSHSRRKQ